MTHIDDAVAEWARMRSRAEAPPGFADRVMEAVAAERRGRLVPVAVLALAALAGAARVAAAFAVFFAR